ncbi:MAG: YlxR family protein [Chloroflexi bacterium]|nr:YlxR family protein [Chloroflexota bacterium]
MSAGAGVRHIPLRRCVACGQQYPQRDLVRIVRGPDGSVLVDQGRRKLPGRGAYLCRSRECWNQALKKSRLSYALRGDISPNDKGRLQEFAESQLSGV